MSVEKSSRKKSLLLLSLFFIAVAVGAGSWWFWVLRGSETTDDAYVAGNIVPVMPQVAGNVLSLHVDDTQLVAAGMTLVELDPTDAKLALVRSEIQLAQTLRQVQQQMAEQPPGAQQPQPQQQMPPIDAQPVPQGPPMMIGSAV